MWGIRKHRKGSFYSEDYLLWDEKYKTLRYKYRESADFMADKLNKEDRKNRYTVVRLDDEYISE